MHLKRRDSEFERLAHRSYTMSKHCDNRKLTYAAFLSVVFVSLLLSGGAIAPAFSKDVHTCPPDRVKINPPTPKELLELKQGPANDITITDCRMTLNGMAVDVGNLTATVSVIPGHTMSATFTTTPGIDWLCDCIEFHWVQIITQDDCPATYEGAWMPMPIVDAPEDGWDYMYFDVEQRTDPNFGIPRYGWYIDAEPWVYSEVGQAGTSVACSTYSMSDSPSFCMVHHGAVHFQTWLVVEVGPRTMGLIAGYAWSVCDLGNTGPVDLGPPTDLHALEVATALETGFIEGWTVQPGANVTCMTGVPGISGIALAALVVILVTIGALVAMRSGDISAG